MVQQPRCHWVTVNRVRATLLLLVEKCEGASATGSSNVSVEGITTVGT